MRTKMKNGIYFFFGPKFLYQPENEWPKTNIYRSPSLHIFATTTTTTPPELSFFLIDAVSNVSSWHGKKHRAASIIMAARRWKASVGARTRRARAAILSIGDIGRDHLEEAECERCNVLWYEILLRLLVRRSKEVFDALFSGPWTSLYSVVFLMIGPVWFLCYHPMIWEYVLVK